MACRKDSKLSRYRKRRKSYEKIKSCLIMCQEKPRLTEHNEGFHLLQNEYFYLETNEPEIRNMRFRRVSFSSTN